MLKTIEVEIDTKGHIRPLEKLPLPLKGKSRALLTILPDLPETQKGSGTISRDAPAFGVLKADRTVTLEEMEAVIQQRGSRL